MIPAGAAEFAAKYGARLLLWGAAVAFVFGGGLALGLKLREAQVANLRAEHAEAAANAEREATRQVNEYRQREHEMGDRFAAVSLRHQQDLRNVKAERDALAADLRAGRERLHERWTCPAAPAAVPGPAAARPGADAGARDREASAGRAIAAADACDAQVIGLQRLLLSERTGNKGR